MKKRIALLVPVLLASLALAGCDDVPAVQKDETHKFELPKEMSDCKVFNLQSTRKQYVIAIWCPASTTTNVNYVCGKGCTDQIAVIQRISE